MVFRVLVVALTSRLPGFVNSPGGALTTLLSQVLLIWPALGLPLYRSYVSAHKPVVVDANVNPELRTLRGVLSSAPGRLSFEKHLMLEFALGTCHV